MKIINLNNNFVHQNILIEIQNYCHNNKLDYIDGIINWCEKNDVEIEYISDMIKCDSVFKAKIQYEAEELHYLKRPRRVAI
jgi:hypothetical protein